MDKVRFSDTVVRKVSAVLGKVRNIGKDSSLKEFTTELSLEKSVEKNEDLKLPVVEILITDDGFEPEEVTVKVGQTVMWHNQRGYTKAIVAGMREIIQLRSPPLAPEKKFYWRFDTPGKFTYVDAVVIGHTGKIIVE